jgi:hypothetical protein
MEIELTATDKNGTVWKVDSVVLIDPEKFSDPDNIYNGKPPKYFVRKVGTDEYFETDKIEIKDIAKLFLSGKLLPKHLPIEQKTHIVCFKEN